MQIDVRSIFERCNNVAMTDASLTKVYTNEIKWFQCEKLIKPMKWFALLAACTTTLFG